MKPHLLISYCIFLILFSACQSRTPIAQREITDIGYNISKASNSLGIKLFTRYSESHTKKENILLANSSIYQAISLLYLGAQGESLNNLYPFLAMNNTQGFHLTNKNLNDIIKNRLVAKSHYSSNMLWYQKHSFPLKKSYKANSKNYYNDATRMIDFAQGMKSQQTIQYFIQQSTHGHFPDFRKDTSNRDEILFITSGTSLNLILEDWGKGVWKDFVFYVSENAPIHIASMQKNFPAEAIKYTNNKLVEIISFPLLKDTLKMNIYMPQLDMGSYIKDLREKGEFAEAEEILRENIQIKMPIIAAKMQCNILPLLVEEVEDKTTFEALNLNAMTLIENGSYNINSLAHFAQLSLIAQKNMSNNSAENRTISIDKPFIYTIVEEKTNTILLMGLYAQPK